MTDDTIWRSYTHKMEELHSQNGGATFTKWRS